MAGGQERILKERIRSVRATKKITRAMELIAASRIVKAQARVAAAVPYSEARAAVRASSRPTMATSSVSGLREKIRACWRAHPPVPMTATRSFAFMRPA